MLRLHPDDRVGRYLKYRHAPEVTLDIPESYFATLGWTMTRADLTRTAWLLRHADVMVNFATTLTLEAAIVDTPTLLVAFSPIDPDEMERYVVGLHFKLHYRDIVERNLAPVAWNRDELIGWINRYLERAGSSTAPSGQTIVRDWVQFTDGRSGERLGDAILRAAGLGALSAGRAAGGARARWCACDEGRLHRAGPAGAGRRHAREAWPRTRSRSADALAAAGVEVSLLATNTRAAAPDEPPARCRGWLLYRSVRRRLDEPPLPGRDRRRTAPALPAARRVGCAQSRLAPRPARAIGSGIAASCALVRPDVVHVQHPLERLSTARARCSTPSAGDSRSWRPLHSFFGEHADVTIRSRMAPNLALADRLIAVSPHIADAGGRAGRRPDAAGRDPLRSRRRPLRARRPTRSTRGARARPRTCRWCCSWAISSRARGSNG